MAPFAVHGQLLDDAHRIGRLRACHVLLHRNALVPWFILVPETDVCELLDLPGEDLKFVMNESALVSRFIKETLGYPKVNFGSIGNVVPQLHLHVIGRRPGDPCWPAPVWGHLQRTREYTDAELRRLTEAFIRHAGNGMAGR